MEGLTAGIDAVASVGGGLATPGRAIEVRIISGTADATGETHSVWTCVSTRSPGGRASSAAAPAQWTASRRGVPHQKDGKNGTDKQPSNYRALLFHRCVPVPQGEVFAHG